MNIGQPSLTRRHPLVEHGWPSGARVSRHPTGPAGSHHSYGVDSTTRRFRRCSNISQNGLVHAPVRAHQALLSSTHYNTILVLY